MTRRESLKVIGMAFLSLAGLKGLEKPAWATTLIEKPFVCAYCGRLFRDRTVASTNTLGGQDSEFRTYAAGEQPIPYFIHTCPGCGSPDITSIVLPGTPEGELRLSHAQSLEVGKFLTTFQEMYQLSPRDYAAYQKYEILANVYALLAAPSLQVAEAYLNAAWMADDADKRDKGREYRVKTIDHLRKAFQKKEISPELKPVFTYLIGELYRRIGKFQEAVSWFGKVETSDPLLAKLCSRQKTLALNKNFHRVRLDVIQ